jgi:HAD superfamily hydrolase (TIGR01509 family)
VLSAVIFDMDGVLIDSETIWARKEYDMFKMEYPGWTKERQRQLAGRSVEDIFALMKGWYPALPYDLDGWRELYLEFASEIYGKETQLNPGVKELVFSLRNSGLKIALATSTSRELLNVIIKRFDLSVMFDVIITASEVEGKGKPAPDIYLRTLDVLGVAAQDAIAIEDTPNGIKAAKAAGLYCIGYVSDPDYDRSEADLVVDDFSHLDIERLGSLID